MAKSKRSSSQPSRQERRLVRQREDLAQFAAERLSSGRGVSFAVPSERAALAARLWNEVTGGEGVALVDGKPVDPEGGR